MRGGGQSGAQARHYAKRVISRHESVACGRRGKETPGRSCVKSAFSCSFSRESDNFSLQKANFSAFPTSKWGFSGDFQLAKAILALPEPTAGAEGGFSARKSPETCVFESKTALFQLDKTSKGPS